MRNRRLPAAENRLGIRRAVDQRDFVEHEACDRFWVSRIPLCKTTSNGKAPINSISHLSHGDRVYNMGDYARRSVVTDFRFKCCTRGG